MLELKFCSKEELDIAARLLIKAHAPSDARAEDVYGYYLQQLKRNLAALAFSVEPSRVVILGQSPEGIVHGAYEIPRLNTFEGSLELRRGYIAAEPENKGFGSQLFTGVTRVLEQVAFELDKP